MVQRKTIYMLTACFATGVIFIYLLSRFSYTYNRKPNHFIRLFPPHFTDIETTFTLQNKSYYFAGISAGHIYLGNGSSPLRVLVLPFSLKDTASSAIAVGGPPLLNRSGTSIIVDSPFFYLNDRLTPAIYGGLVNQWEVRRFMYDSAFFSGAIPISNSSFALRVVSREPYENALSKETAASPHLATYYNILQKQIDGIFCTDGLLHYDKQLSMLVYIYFYRNQYICMDTNLHVTSKGRTIDTVTTAKLKISKVFPENIITFSAPPLTVNKHNCVDGKFLFNCSGLKADNENKTAFEESSVIDVYNLVSNKYLGSFYVQDYDHKKLSGFLVRDNILVAMYENYLVTFEINIDYFKKLAG